MKTLGEHVSTVLSSSFPLPHVPSSVTELWLPTSCPIARVGVSGWLGTRSPGGAPRVRECWGGQAMSWGSQLLLLVRLKATWEPFGVLPPGRSERDCKTSEALPGAKVLANVLIKPVVPKKKYLGERFEKRPSRKSLPYKERGCVEAVMGLAEVPSIGYKVRKDVLIANPEKFGAVAAMSPPCAKRICRGFLQRLITGPIPATRGGEPEGWRSFRHLWKRDFSC